jgi:hypothetical protein
VAPEGYLWIGAIWVASAIGAAGVASTRGANAFVWFLTGLVLGPFGFMASLSSGPGATCNACRKPIHKEATKCPYCQSAIERMSIQS